MKDITQRSDIEHLVETFYAKVFSDETIGFIFTEVAHVTPKEHFPVMSDFWETVLFGQNRYHGNPIHKHVELNHLVSLEKHHFDRWVALFCQTVDELFAGPKAEVAKTRARTVAMVLQAKINTLPTQFH
ncbi:MAG: hypothetical protein AVDCRST_MAG56-1465 [uncultured Cytophagales bacterium]|uniref:Hemoglobins n=1 Tax=uncultured Cytophagales bacterium TaxID=158755 RepID=A0A6J4I573_9SPHI|nr:MAG: hypothetical protein AVDCRST_MAG56-1465 [uncultured Cytophagales bacterium]